MIKTIDVKSGETAGLYQYLSSTITPRPITFVSTIDKSGNKNLSPFSFFNVFSVNPPILVFSREKSKKQYFKTYLRQCITIKRMCYFFSY